MTEPSQNYQAGEIDQSVPSPPPFSPPHAPPLPNPPIKSSSPPASSDGNMSNNVEWGGIAVLLPGEKLTPLAVGKPRIPTRVSLAMVTSAEGFKQPDTEAKRAQDRSLTRAMEEHPLVNEETIIKQQRFSEAANRAKRALQKSGDFSEQTASPGLVKSFNSDGLSPEHLISYAIGAGVVLIVLFFWPQIREAIGNLFTVTHVIPESTPE